MLKTSTESESPFPIPFGKRSFTPAQAAAILGIAESTLFELLKSQRLRSFKIGRARRVTGEAIDAFRNARS